MGNVYTTLCMFWYYSRFYLLYIFIVSLFILHITQSLILFFFFFFSHYRWVTSSTHGKLRKVIDPSPTPQPLTVVNCVYFHGTWKREFTPSNTPESTFTGLHGSKDCSMMKQTATLPYVKTESFQAVEVPYLDRYSKYSSFPNPSSLFSHNFTDLWPL